MRSWPHSEPAVTGALCVCLCVCVCVCVCMQVSLVGHSQGGTISTAMLTRPPPGGGEHPIDVLVNVAVSDTHTHTHTVCMLCKPD